MRLHLLGICGTFMAGVAQLARELGHEVSGSDAGVYPPMSEFLARAGINIRSGWDPAHLEPRPDLVVIGNALSRGNPLVEAVLDSGIPYTSGPAWLADAVLPGRRVLVVSGTHGKTTTSSLLAHVLDACGENPGFLIGGIPENFDVPARLGTGRCFVLEGDEYDTAFFDKRSKFVHYRPEILIINNLEFDHADIFPDLGAIETQFHHLLRTVPRRGQILWNADDHNIPRVLARGIWSASESFGTSASSDWQLVPGDAGKTHALRPRDEDSAVPLSSPLAGIHNALNATAVIAAAAAIGISWQRALAALASFRNVRRRLEVVGTAHGITVHDDFAHHPTAIAATLQALREKVGRAPVQVALELRSNTMRMGVHDTLLAPALAAADGVSLLVPRDLGWDAAAALGALGAKCRIYPELESMLRGLEAAAVAGSHVIFMSNGSFAGAPRSFLERLRNGSQ